MKATWEKRWLRMKITDTISLIKQIMLKLRKTLMLTSIMKSQYGEKRSIISTPEGHKRSNYRGIVSFNKKENCK